MKSCPRCKRTFEDSWKVCLECSVPLEDALEARLSRLEDQARTILAEIDGIRQGASSAVRPAPQKTAAAAAAAEPAAREDTETRIGKYWFNKAGIFSVVLGVAFFLSYTFHYLSPAMKILIGLAVGVAMAASGAWIDRLKKYQWYGRALLAGGWVTGYFTVYAMHYVSATRIVSSASLDLALLSAVLAAMIVHLFRYRSQSLVILVLVLGYVTASLHSHSFASFFYVALLALGACGLLLRMDWQGVGAFSLFGTYLTYFAWHQSAGPSDASAFWTNLGFLTLYWAIYNATGFLMKTADEKARHGLKAFLFLNSLFFAPMAFLELGVRHGSWRAGFALAAAGVLALLGLAARALEEKKPLASAYWVSSVMFASASLRYLVPREWASFIWLCEAPLIVWAGFYFDQFIYRAAGFCLALVALGSFPFIMSAGDPKMAVFGKQIYVSVFLPFGAAGIFYVMQSLYSGRRFLDRADERERWASPVYSFIAGPVFLAASYGEIQSGLLTLVWALVALCLFVPGFLLRSKALRYSAVAFIGAAVLRGLFVDLAGLETLYRIAVFIGLGVILLAVSFWYAKASAALEEKNLSDRGAARIVSAALILAFSAAMILTASVRPSSFRMEKELLAKEVAVTARFMEKKSLSPDEIDFLRRRKFERLNLTLARLPLDAENAGNLDFYSRAFDMGFSSEAAYARVGGYFEKEKQPAKALEYYEKSLALNPSGFDWQTTFTERSAAKLYLDAGNFTRAAALYEKIAPAFKNTEDLYNLAVCYKNLGRFDKALEMLSEAIKTDRGGVYMSKASSLRDSIYEEKPALKTSQTAQDKKLS